MVLEPQKLSDDEQHHLRAEQAKAMLSIHCGLKPPGCGP